MKININETWCFTGHRLNKLYGYDEYSEGNIRLKFLLTSQIINLYMNHGVRNFISGMAQGWDMFGAEIILELRDSVLPGIKLICAIPCKNHHENFPIDVQNNYLQIIKEADYVHNVTGIKYFPRCLQIRNEWMVNNSVGQLACWDRTNGGTANCIRYADSVNKTKRIVINPKTFNVEVNINGI